MDDDEYDKLAFPVVSRDAATNISYPVVFVADDGSAHEVDAEDREYLEEHFHPCDGGRPYVKSSYQCKDGWGSIRGFCFRKHIPAGLPISNIPFERGPAKPLLERIREVTEVAGLRLEERPDGSFVTVARADVPRRRRWWQFWKSSS